MNVCMHVPPGTYVLDLWLIVLCMRSKAWLAARVISACLALQALLSAQRSTRAAAPVLLAHAEVTKNKIYFSMGPKLRYPGGGTGYCKCRVKGLTTYVLTRFVVPCLSDSTTRAVPAAKPDVDTTSLSSVRSGGSQAMPLPKPFETRKLLYAKRVSILCAINLLWGT